MNKKYPENICAGIVGFRPEVKLEKIIDIAEKLAKLKNFKKVFVRKNSPDCWGIEVMFKREKTANTEPVSNEIVPLITKYISKSKIGMWDLSGSIIPIKPKKIR